jgi:hypothetical protein
MARYFGATVFFRETLEPATSLTVVRRLLTATHEVWKLVQCKNSVLDKHLAELAALEEHTTFLIQNPIPEDLRVWRDGETSDEFYARRKKSRYWDDPSLLFSPLSTHCLFGFPRSRAVIYPPPGSAQWSNEVTVRISSKFQIDDDDPEDMDDLRGAGLADVAVVPFNAGRVPFERSAQREVFEYLCNEFDQRKDQYQSEDRWQFNSRALAYVISAVWSTFPVEELKVIYPGHDD